MARVRPVSAVNGRGTGRGWRLSLIACALALVSACTKRNPAYCSLDSDCSSGWQCNVTESPKHTCILIVDAGTDGGDASEAGDASEGGAPDGGDGGDGGDARDSKTGCSSNGDCGDGGPGVCEVDSGTCVGCLASTDCSGATPACDTNTKTCVGCLSSTDCSGATPACSTNTKTCVGCLASTDCSGATPACNTDTKTCVECLSNVDCGAAAKPICDTAHHTCVKCTSDAECVGKLGADPGVCMAHEDGRCAAATEAIFVQQTSLCSDASPTAGTPGMPYCTMGPVMQRLGTGAIDLVIVRGTVTAGTWTFTGATGEVSIVGQQSAFIASAASPALAMASGQLYVRDVKASSSASLCLSAKGGTLRLEHVTVDSCLKGGILLDGAAFDIRDTTVTNNGPGTQGTTLWGGVLVSSLPAAGTTGLTLVTIQGNKQIGLTCAGGIQGTGVLATGNTGGDVNPYCNVSACAAAGPTCGAQ
jgi:hypothetical protein